MCCGNIGPYSSIKDLLALWGRITVYKYYSLALKSIEIAVKYEIAVYDALYLALSIATNPLF